MITKERFIEICKEAGLYVTDFDKNSFQDEIWTYLNNRDTKYWVARYDGPFGGGNVFVSDRIDYYVNDNETYSIYGQGSCLVKDEEMFKKHLQRLITRYKNIKKNLRKKMIREL